MLSQTLYAWWSQLYVYLLRPMLKWFFRYVTGKCELLRISYEETERVQRVKKTEQSLKSSRHSDLKNYSTGVDYDIDEAVKNIIELKTVICEVHSQFGSTLADSLYRIRSYNKILQNAEELRKVKYSSDNAEHEAQLQKLWSLYQPDRRLPARVGDHWQDIGFQGEDPATDFRGMGLLGLQQMIYFATTYPDAAKHTLSQSHHPQYGYSLAIVSINMTSLGYELLNKRKLRSHFYSLEKREPDLQDFHNVFCHLLSQFSQFWLDEKPRDVMEFSRVRDKYMKTVKKKLKSSNPVLASDFQRHQ